MSSNKTESFDYLLMGLKEYLDREKKYPYPDLLRHGMNALSLHMKKSIPFPKTMNGFLQFVSEPVNDWCPKDFIPQEKDVDPKQSIRGAVREACVLNNISSQMLQTVEPMKKDNTAYNDKTRGRTLNAVLDLTLR